jgi:hypothetical protein
LLWEKEYRLLKTVTMGVEAGIPLIQQLMNPFHKEFLVCYWKHCTNAASTSSSNMHLQTLRASLRGLNMEAGFT